MFHQVKIVFQTGDADEFNLEVPYGSTIASLFELGRPLHGQGNPESYIYNVIGVGVQNSGYVIDSDCRISVTPDKLAGGK